jgi:Zn-dependent M28 family amino/carboxypeptidase
LLTRLARTIVPAELRGDLSFLASDELKGRFTPSPGLNVAAEFIASRFRGAGLQPGGEHDSFFQEAAIEDRRAKLPDSTTPASVIARNVIAILPGSDPKLRDTYVLLTAHYDHIGTTATAGKEAGDHPSPDNSDLIYNGANDDGSGTVSVIAIARALAARRVRPKRSIVFVLFFGEELGLRGSEFYAEHSLIPLSKMVAELNLEQVGRTDSSEGPEIARVSLTGTGYSSLPSYVQCAASTTGLATYVDPGNDDYFVRSDNAVFARHGIPAHTLCVSFDYPDYHRVGDEWQKIDYDNMAKVDRTVAIAVLNVANSVNAPHWNAANPKAAPFMHPPLQTTSR